jgi:hypothetical protein
MQAEICEGPIHQSRGLTINLGVFNVSELIKNGTDPRAEESTRTLNREHGSSQNWF